MRVASSERLLRRAFQLVGFTLACDVVEGVIALGSGQVAGSVALIGFGFDSAVESAASILVHRRLRVETRGDSSERVASAERAVCRVACDRRLHDLSGWEGRPDERTRHARGATIASA